MIETPSARAHARRTGTFYPDNPVQALCDAEQRAAKRRREERNARRQTPAWIGGGEVARAVAATQEELDDVGAGLCLAARWQNILLDLREERAARAEIQRATGGQKWFRASNSHSGAAGGGNNAVETDEERQVRANMDSAVNAVGAMG